MTLLEVRLPESSLELVRKDTIQIHRSN